MFLLLKIPKGLARKMLQEEHSVFGLARNNDGEPTEFLIEDIRELSETNEFVADEEEISDYFYSKKISLTLTRIELLFLKCTIHDELVDWDTNWESYIQKYGMDFPRALNSLADKLNKIKSMPSIEIERLKKGGMGE